MLNNLSPEFLILELSSFQTEIKAKLNLDFAICLNVSPSHMERYCSFDMYKNAKLNIKNHVMDKTNYYDLENIFLEDASLVPNEFYVSSKAGIESYSFLTKILKTYEIDTTQITEFSEHFEKLPFRQQLVYRDNNIKVINDSKSTNWSSTETLINTYLNNNNDNGSEEIFLLVGGKKRDDIIQIDEQLLKKLSNKNIHLLTFGEVGNQLTNYFGNYQIPSKFDHLENHVKNLKNKSGIVLFSPAYPSFDQFKNYVERGNYFTELFK